MADTRKPRTKPGPTGKSQPGRGSGSGTAARNRRQPDKGKLARGAAARRLEEKRRRQRTLLWSGVAVLSLLALLALIWFEGRSDTPQASNQSVSPAALEAGRTAAGSKGVQTFPEAGRDHISPGEQPDNWNSNPPTSGDHLASPLAPGVYTSDQDMRAMVHNLEHGYVVMVYKGIPDDQVAQLRQFVEARNGSKLVLSPWSGLDSNGVALVAWRNLELLQRVNMDVVQAFVNDFMVPEGTKSVAPEPTAG
ncbi:MAG TPA: DUF3105 domain-containing protein [Actinomycetota bacterium]|jgi:hypothetical protein|nr:DUF3105 domain-containing protein [Actinomycetota bacterium]